MTALDFIASEHELYHRYMVKVCVRFSLTSMELAILLFLANNPQYDTAKDVVEKRHLTKSHVSISIRSLEEKGLLRKEFRNGNHRTSHLVLLPDSEAMVAAGREAQNEVFSIMTKGFSKSELELIKSHLQRVYENVMEELNKKEIK